MKHRTNFLQNDKQLNQDINQLISPILPNTVLKSLQWQCLWYSHICAERGR